MSEFQIHFSKTPPNDFVPIGITFLDPKEAAAFVKLFNSNNEAKIKIVRAQNPNVELIAAIKQKRDNGELRLPPWQNEDWYLPLRDEHFCHITDKNLVAYYDRDYTRPIQVTPGRYLDTYASILSHSRRGELCSLVELDLDAYTLHFAHTADEIEEIYTNEHAAPQSCMRYPAGEHYDEDEEDYRQAYDSYHHPARAYAGPDLAVAFIRDKQGRAQGRVLCWPDKKLYGRLYGHDYNMSVALGAKLRTEGYQSGPLAGARMSRINDQGWYLMPYLDNNLNARDDGEYLILDPDGSIEGNVTDGLSGAFRERRLYERAA